MRKTALLLGAAALLATAAQGFTPLPEKVLVPASRVTASTQDTNVPGNTVDGSLATRWSGYGDGAWIAYDLGAERLVTQVRIATYNGNARRGRFDIQISSDTVGWSTVKSAMTSGTTTGLESFDVPASTRYLRYLGHGFVSNGTNTPGLWNSLTELEVWAQPATPGAPTSVRALTGNGQIELSWTGTGSGGYQFFVKRRSDPCDAFAYVAAIPWMPTVGNRYSWVDSTVTLGQHYEYVVVASAAGESPDSAPAANTAAHEPPSITTLSGTDGGESSVNLSWTPVFAATRYEIRRTILDLACGCARSYLVPIATVTGTSYVDANAPPGFKYMYFVHAQNGSGTGERSNPVTITQLASRPTPTPRPTPCACEPPLLPPPMTQPPAPPVNITAELSYERLKLSWSPGSSQPTSPNRTLRYHLFRATNACGPFVRLSHTFGTSYIDKGLTNGTTYYYRVLASNPQGESTGTEVVAAAPGLYPPPAAPGHMMFLPDTTPEYSSVRVSWPIVWQADSYNLKRSTAAGGPYTTVATGVTPPVGWQEAFYVDHPLQLDTTYYYVLEAVNPAGTSPPSAESSIFIQLKPDNITDLTAEPGNGQVILRWSAAARADTYNCGKSQGSSNGYEWGHVTTGTSVVIGNLQNNTRYYFRCIPRNPCGSAYPGSNEATAIPVVQPSVVLEVPPGGVTASTHDGNLPANTVDNNLATRWSASGDGQWIQYDLGTAKTVTEIRIAWYLGNQRASGFDVYGAASETAPMVGLITQRTSSGTSTALEAFDLPDTTLRFIRIVGHGNNDPTKGSWNSITEVDIYGY